jgi:hypothetical protein
MARHGPASPGFAEGRMGYRAWAQEDGKLDNIQSIDDP